MGHDQAPVELGPHTVFFLIASAVFRDGLAGVFTFGAIIAAGTFGFSAGDVLIFGVVANIVAGIATITFGALDDKIGPKKVIMISLIAMSIDGILIFIFHDAGTGVFWVLGLILTVFVGPAQSASRSFLARVIPEGREAKFWTVRHDRSRSFVPCSDDVWTIGAPWLIFCPRRSVVSVLGYSGHHPNPFGGSDTDYSREGGEGSPRHIRGMI